MKQWIPGFLLLFFLVSHAVAALEIKTWSFDVYLDKDLIGEHNFIVTEVGNKQYIEINANFDVKFLFFTAYKYRHSNREVWRDECLESIESFTDDNGKQYRIEGKQQQSSFKVNINNAFQNYTGCIRSFYYWDSKILSQHKLLNSQTGLIENIKVENYGQQQITVADKKTMANHYRLTTEKFFIDLWYSDQGEWLALKSTTEEGNALTYKLRREIDEANTTGS